ncbi:hypothetical protein J6590_069825 [Homalodisca vitripennis]|nr:hypothetical protein J6590_069825 [Homalodisca vitripennis]
MGDTLIVSDASRVANKFNGFFASVACGRGPRPSLPQENPTCRQSPIASMALTPVLEEELDRIIQQLPAKRSNDLELRSTKNKSTIDAVLSLVDMVVEGLERDVIYTGMRLEAEITTVLENTERWFMSTCLRRQVFISSTDCQILCKTPKASNARLKRFLVSNAFYSIDEFLAFNWEIACSFVCSSSELLMSISHLMDRRPGCVDTPFDTEAHPTACFRNNYKGRAPVDNVDLFDYSLRFERMYAAFLLIAFVIDKVDGLRSCLLVIERNWVDFEIADPYST